MGSSIVAEEEHRPGPSDSRSLTVRAALKLSALETGAPEVVAGRQALDREVRWVHIAESADVTNVLHGGELLLSEGYMFNGRQADDRQLIAELAERNISALVIELDRVFRSIPRHLVDEAEARGLPLVALHLPVPFIDVTESIHRQIVTRQLTLFDRAQKVQDDLTSIVLSGGGASDVLEALAESLGNPVIYELDGGGFGGRALRGHTDREVSAAWEAFTRGLEGAPETLEAELVARGNRLGRVVLLATKQPLTPSDAVALERCAATLVLAMLAEDQGDRLEKRRNGGLLGESLRGELEPFVAEGRAAAMGFKPRFLLPMTLRGARHSRPRTASTEERLWTRVLDDVTTDLRSRLKAVLIDEAGPADTTLVLIGLSEASHRERTADLAAKIVTAATQRHLGVPDAAILCVAAPVHTWQAALDGFDLCNETTVAAIHCPPRAWHDATDVDLDRLLWNLRESRDLERFVRVRLASLVQHDRNRRTELVKTLGVLLEHNGHKARTARALHLERQALYNRMARIESLARVNLADADTRLGLHLAIRMMSHLDPDSWVE